MIDVTDAIYALNPSIVVIRGDVAYDQEGNEVAYSKSAAQAKLIELQDEKAAKAQATITSKASALSKLAALGLTQDEVKALIG